jgi:hypothetical protein
MVLMAGAALLRSHSLAVGPAPHVHRVLMAIVSLPREIAVRMTVHAAGVPQDRDESGKESSVSGRWSCGNGGLSGRGFRRVDPAQR